MTFVVDDMTVNLRSIVVKNVYGFSDIHHCKCVTRNAVLAFGILNKCPNKYIF